VSVDALRSAQAAEHAAIFGYGVVGAFLTGDTREAARQAEQLHRTRRDEVSLRVEAGGGELVAAEPAYALPIEVTNVGSAMALAVQLEEGTAGAWREALSATTGDDRRLALDALIACAVMATRWRQAAQIQPVTLTFPGSV
jgi:ferritin-like protein